VWTLAVQTPNPPSVASAKPVESLPPPTHESGPAVGLADWVERFTAWLIDWAILFGAAVAIAVAVTYPDTSEAATQGGAFVAILVLIPVTPLYFGFLNGRGKTIGKRLEGITVVDAESLQPIGFGRGVVRELVRLALFPFFIFLVEGLLPLWDKRKQTLHDKVARSIVVRDP
jgi:uncharacterized RDD family membrane protein YckC